MRYGYHLLTDCRKANQGNKSHKDVEATIIHHFNTYTSITATKARPFTDDSQADILLSGVSTIDNPAARVSFLDVTSTNPMGVTNQEFMYLAAPGHQQGPEEHDVRNDVLTSAKRAEEGLTLILRGLLATDMQWIGPFDTKTWSPGTPMWRPS